MFNKLKSLSDQYEQISKELTNPDIINDKKAYTKALRDLMLRTHTMHM